MTRWMRLFAILTALALMAAACGDDDGGGESASGGVPDCEPGQVDGDLRLYNWSEYIDPQLKDDFAAEFGVEVTEDFYDSNEAMQPIISAGNSGYDVIVPSDYMVSIMIEAGDLVPLNRDAIPNLANLAPDFASDLPFDPEGAYSVPYQWGTTGLGVDLAVTGDDVPRSWGLIFDEAMSQEYGVAGSITMLNDPRESLGAALKFLGYSLNTTSEDELNEAKDLLSAARGRLLAFDSDQYDELLVSGESAVAHGFSGNMLVSIGGADDPSQYTYFVPDEGGTRWVDNMAIAKDAPHPCTAHAFINFILDAENGATLTNWNSYGSPNAAAEEFIDPAILEDPTIYPTDTSNLEFISNTGDFEINFSDAFIEAKG
jgi:spermidine/putrescine-binding protein